MEKMEKADLMRIVCNVREWEEFRQHHEDHHTLKDLKRQLEALSDEPVAQIRLVVCINKTELSPEEQIRQLRTIKHPLAEGYRVFLESDLDEDFDHRQNVLKYLGTDSEPRHPFEVLFGNHDGNEENPEEMEAYMRLHFGLGRTLLRENLPDLATESFKTAQYFADCLQYDYVQLCSAMSLAQMRVAIGHYDDVDWSLQNVLERSYEGSEEHQNLARSATLNKMWVDYVQGNKLEIPHAAARDTAFTQILEQCKKFLYNQKFSAPKRLMAAFKDLPATQLLYYMDRGRSLGYAIRDMNFKTIQQCCEAIFELPDVRYEESMTYYCAVWVKSYALMHCGRMDESLALIRDKMLSRRSELGRLTAASLLGQAQFLLGDTHFLEDLPEVYRETQRYFQKVPNFVGARMVDLSGRGVPNSLYMFDQLGDCGPELGLYVQRNCVMVTPGAATFRGKVVKGYPIQSLGFYYPKLFTSPPTTSLEKERDRIALGRHLKALQALNHTEIPGVVYVPAVQNVIEFLKSRGNF